MKQRLVSIALAALVALVMVAPAYATGGHCGGHGGRRGSSGGHHGHHPGFHHFHHRGACSSASRPSSRFRTGGMTRRTTTLRPSSSPSHPSTSSSSLGGSRTGTTARARALTTRTRRAVLSPGSRFPPLLADRRSPGRFYIDRQSSSSVRPLAPVVDRDGVLVGAAHDAPVPVGLAPDHHDVDVLAPEHRDQLVRRGAQVGCPRLLAER